MASALTKYAVREFSTALRSAREARGLSQAELASRVGRHFSTVSAWERSASGDGDGESSAEPPRADVFRLEEILGLAPGSLSRHLGYLPVTTSTAPPTLEEWLSTQSFSEHRKNIIRHLVAEMNGTGS